MYINTFCEIITHEIRIDYTGSKQRIISLNLQFTKKAFEILTKNIENQQTYDRIFHLKSISKHIIISFFKLALKFNNKWRKIHHLFYSFKKSVNDNISKTFKTIEYTTVDKAIEKIFDLGSGTMLIKKDLADAFRHVPVAEINWWLLGFRWQEQCWINRFLFFGLRTFPFLFDLFVKNINWIICKKKWQCIHYLNDFLIFIFSDDDYQTYEKFFAELCNQLNINIKIEKSFVKFIAIFLNIELNIVNMIVRLFANKQKTVLEKIDVVLKTKSISYEALESLIGLLFFACKVVISEKSFLRHFYDALAASEREHHIKINKTVKIDFLWWNEFLSKWNDVRFLKRIKFIAEIYTNVSNNWNMRKYFLINEQIVINIDVFKAFFIKFHQRLQNKHINTKKMIVVKRTFCTWFFSIYEYHVIIYDDNYAVVRELHKTSIKDNAMFPLRKIMIMIALNDIFIKSWWISTHENELADALSRRNFKKIIDKYFLLQGVISTPFATHSSNGIKKLI